MHLKHLALEENDADPLRDAVRDPQGKLVRPKFSWLKRGNAQMGECRARIARD